MQQIVFPSLPYLFILFHLFSFSVFFQLTSLSAVVPLLKSTQSLEIVQKIIHLKLAAKTFVHWDVLENNCQFATDGFPPQLFKSCFLCAAAQYSVQAEDAVCRKPCMEMQARLSFGKCKVVLKIQCVQSVEQIKLVCVYTYMNLPHSLFCHNTYKNVYCVNFKHSLFQLFLLVLWSPV